MAIVFNGLPKKLKTATTTSNGLMSRSDKVLLQSLSDSVNKILNLFDNNRTLYIKDYNNSVLARYKNIYGNITINIDCTIPLYTTSCYRLFTLDPNTMILPKTDISVPIKYNKNLADDLLDYYNHRDAILHINTNGDCYIIFDGYVEGNIVINHSISYIQ